MHDRAADLAAAHRDRLGERFGHQLGQHVIGHRPAEHPF
jgi:hypothetical protein